MDGTLYNFKEGSFQQSKLRKVILKRAENYITSKLKKTPREARTILTRIINVYKEDISIALEEHFGLNRYDYFTQVWNLPVKPFVTHNVILKKVLHALAREFDFVLISDAPRVWILRVLKALKVENFFQNKIFSGEGNARKGFGNAFDTILKKIKKTPQECIVVGDQMVTDIIPAKRLGMATILVSKNRNSKMADSVIRDINQLPQALSILISHVLLIFLLLSGRIYW